MVEPPTWSSWGAHGEGGELAFSVDGPDIKSLKCLDELGRKLAERTGKMATEVAIADEVVKRIAGP